MFCLRKELFISLRADAISLYSFSLLFPWHYWVVALHSKEARKREMGKIRQARFRARKREMNEYGYILDKDRQRKAEGMVQKSLNKQTKLEKAQIRQIACRLKKNIPTSDKLYGQVLLHMTRNADRESRKIVVNGLVHMPEAAEQRKYSVQEANEVNKTLRLIAKLKRQNRIPEQQKLAASLRLQYGSYNEIAGLAGRWASAVHEICAVPKQKLNKHTEGFRARQAQVEDFLNQETISQALPGKRHANTRFLNDTWAGVAQKYHEQTEFHTKGKVAASTLRSKSYKPKSCRLKCQSKIPYNQCLCNYCCNFELLRMKLVNCGTKGLSGSKFQAVMSTLCEERVPQRPSNKLFPRMKCLSRQCDDCSLTDFKDEIVSLNAELVLQKTEVEWWEWKNSSINSSQPLQIQKKATWKAAFNRYLEHLEQMPMHLFRADWHRNILEILKTDIDVGVVAQLSDFAMNYTIRYQDEIQQAFWRTKSVTIIATVNLYRCTVAGCDKVCTDSVVHISDDMLHDSFMARGAMNKVFQYLVDKGVPIDHIIQLSDNCASQYKSRRPFSELSRSAFRISRVFLGEKHGKNLCDAIFGKVKGWMEKKIRARQVIVRSHKDFLKVCQEQYPQPTENTNDGCGARHKAITFQALNPSDIKRKQDCDLDKPIPGTRNIYYVRNTDEILQLKTRQVPCFCRPCQREEGACINSEFTDEWELHKLVPKPGDNLSKHRKRKRPTPSISGERDLCQDEPASVDIGTSHNQNLEEEPVASGNADVEALSAAVEIVSLDSGDEGDDFVSVSDPTIENQEIRLDEEGEDIEEVIIQSDEDNEEVEVTDRIAVDDQSMMRAVQDSQIHQNNFFQHTAAAHIDLSDEVPRTPARQGYWECVLEKFNRCDSMESLMATVYAECEKGLPQMPKLKMPTSTAGFPLDSRAQAEYPNDGPKDLKAVQVYGDGNCFPRAVSLLLFSTQNHHHEVRARMIIEAVVNKHIYLDEEYLKQGATFLHKRSTLPVIYATYSEYFEDEHLSPNAISALYDLEVMGICTTGTYCGIWQFFQACNAFEVSIRSVYPFRGKSTIRKDFNRIFKPYTAVTDKLLINIMWTSTRQDRAINHFVALLPHK